MTLMPCGRRLAACSALLVLLALSACGGGGSSPPQAATVDASPATPSATRAAARTTPTPTATRAAAAPRATPAATATPTPGRTPGPPAATIDGETTWREVYETLTAVERSCIGDALGDAQLEAALERPVVNAGETEQWEPDLYACLDPPTARAVLLAAVMAPLLEGTEAEPTERQLACASAAVAQVDAAAAVAATLPGADPGPAAAVFGGVAGCFPDLFIASILEGAGIDAAELTDAEGTCLRAWMAGPDWRAMLAEESDPEGYGRVLAGLVRCLPGAFVATILRDGGLAPETLSEGTRSCLREWVLAFDWEAVFAGGGPGDDAETFEAALARCAPDLPDDHAGAPAGATALTVGVAIDGALEIPYDQDVFSFEAEQGELYQIDVEPGTLDDPWLELLDPGGVLLDRNDDSADSLAARLLWEAPDSDRHYVKVGGWGIGTYRLTVAVSPLADDHAGSIGGATPVRLGAAIAGAIDHPEDTDRFSFVAVAGRLYQVDVALGTLHDSWVELHGAAGSQLAWNDDVGPWFGSRIVWEAPASARYYVQVGGWDTGSYTLGIRRNAELEEDRTVLLAVRDALRGAAGLNWGADVPLGEWEGVLLDGSPARVAGLFLQGRGLNGVVPPALGKLSGLGALNLRANELTGTIPAELGESDGLLVLLLMGNDLSGEIPATLGDLAGLEVLDLGSNRLSGEVPAALGDLAALRELSLADNELSGPIPPELGGLASLAQLWLGDNRLGGDVPDALGDLAALSALGLGGNELRGCVPDRLQEQLALYEFGRLRFCSDAAERARRAAEAPRAAALPPGSHAGDWEVLVALYRATGGPSWEDFSGWLGEEPIGEWHGVTADADGRVTALRLSGNELEGELPPALARLAGLRVLDLGGNHLRGAIPAELRRLAELEVLDLEGSGLSGTIPPGLGSLAELRELRLGWNELSGSIPPELGGLTPLRKLQLEGNALSSGIPAALGQLAELRELALGWNELSGPIPPELGAVAQLRRLDLGSNELSGPIPPELGRLTSLELLDLSGNGLSGTIPPELGGLTDLRELVLHKNQLSGSIPPELGNLANVEGLILGWNRLDGGLPPELGRLATLERLHLSHNELGGDVPAQLAGATSLRGLYLTGNRLSGCVPASMRPLLTADDSVLPSELAGLPFC
ncbi:MAG: hypothetical protein OXC94_11810 [Chloroflexi bacterium]|nr:hypothetical protein [Chloroflexota bacterium]